MGRSLPAATPRVGREPAREAPHQDQLAERLQRTRERTLELVGGISEDALNRAHSLLLSPLVWDLGHIATFEDLWLVQNAHGAAPLREDLSGVYDPFAAPRSERGALPYLRTSDCLTYMETVRERTLDHLDQADLSADAAELTAGGFVYELVLRHEMQHTETMLQTLQIMTSESYEATPRQPLPPAGREGGGMVEVPAGPFEMGAGTERFAYDNERPRHERVTDAFLIDTTPVSNGDYADFVLDGGYQRHALWSEAGWAWREGHNAETPGYWTRDGDGFAVRSFAETGPLDPSRPVCHVTWHEARAYARWAGKRLPTEEEWEKAASWQAGAPKHAYPWGDEPADAAHANLGQLSFGTAPCGSYARGAAPCGALQMLGDVWEWTESGFEAYEGFRSFPYSEYSEEFFDGPYRVLRGGAWATQPDAVTTTFRNWDHPERRQLFAGFRCAADVED